MSSKFTGVWATYENLDEICEAIEDVRDRGVTPTVLSPCPRHEIDHALGDPQSRVPFISLFFGALGCFIGYGFPAWTASDWVLPVGGKPILAIPAFTVIGVELTILLAATFTLVGVFVLGALETLRNPLPISAKKYLRFQRDRFGIVVSCDPSRISEFDDLLKKHGAEEVHIENN